MAAARRRTSPPASGRAGRPALRSSRTSRGRHRPAPTASCGSVAAPRGTATAARSGARSSPGFASTKPSRPARAASGIGWNATILRRGKRGASASNRSIAVRVPPKARAGLSVGIRRLRRGPAAEPASRFGATRWSSATPSRPSREAAAAAAALWDADIGPDAGAPRIASRTPRARAVSRPERRTVWRIVGTTAVYRPRPVALAPFPGQPVRGLSSVMARPWPRPRPRRPPPPSPFAERRRRRRPDAGRRRDPVPAARARTDVPGAVALRQGGSAANTARWLARSARARRS